MRNDGKAAWPADTRLTAVGGDNMAPIPNSHPEGVAVSADKGEEVEISVELQAPPKPGRYVAHFRMQSDGTRFGHRVWADIVVVEKVEPTPAPAPVQQHESKMSITPDIALAVSAKLRELSTPAPAPVTVAAPAPVIVSAPAPLTAAAPAPLTAGGGAAGAAFVMVDPLPETLLVSEVGDVDNKAAAPVPPTYGSLAEQLGVQPAE